MEHGWIYQKVFENSFNWENSFRTNFEIFFEYVTLHDSHWKTINISDYSETILVIELDAFWNEKFSEPANNEDWPFLIIKIPFAFNINYNVAESSYVIGNAKSEKITQDQISALKNSGIFSNEFYEKLSGVNELSKTTFEDIYGSNIEILHESAIQILLFEKNGKEIKTNLEKDLSSNDWTTEPKKNSFGKFIKQIFKK